MTLFRQAATRHQLAWSDLTAGLSIPDDPKQWMDWEIFAELLERLERMTSVEATIELGRMTPQAEVSGPLQRIAAAAVHLPYLYRFSASWMTPLVLRRVEVEYQPLSRSMLRLTATIPPDMRGSPEWMHLLRGCAEGVPMLLGLPLATVFTRVEEPRRLVVDVQLPVARGGIVSRVRKFFVRSVFRELERQIDELNQMAIERERLEDALRERQRMLTNLIENLSGLIYRCELKDFRFTFASAQSASLLGYQPAELEALAGGLLSLVHPDDFASVQEKRLASLESAAPFSLEYRIHTRSGETRWVLDAARPVYDASGRPVAVEGFMTDVTAKKGLEEQLNRAMRNESIGRLAGGIAHDFNNLLGVILMLSDLSRGQLPADSPVQELAQQIGVAAERAAGLTRQLLAFARKQPITPRVVDLSDLVASMEGLLQRTLMEDIDLKVALESDAWNVAIDPGQFEQVVLNVAINARDAMPSGGTLTVETTNFVLSAAAASLPGMEPGEYVQLRVSDTGEGMTEEVQRRAFEPFFTTKEVGKGTGLGLASTLGIIQQAHGHIFVSSAPAMGTTFRIYLPRHDGPAARPSSERPPAIPRAPIREHILIVEDHGALRRAFADILQAQGYEVLSAGGAVEARELFASDESIGLLVLDVVMPTAKGPELAAEFLAKRPGLPILYVSGYSEHDVLHGHPADSPVAFLAKPCTPGALMAEVHALLAASRRARPPLPVRLVVH